MILRPQKILWGLLASALLPLPAIALDTKNYRMSENIEDRRFSVDAQGILKRYGEAAAKDHTIFRCPGLKAIKADAAKLGELLPKVSSPGKIFESYNQGTAEASQKSQESSSEAVDACQGAKTASLHLHSTLQRNINVHRMGTQLSHEKSHKQAVLIDEKLAKANADRGVGDMINDKLGGCAKHRKDYLDALSIYSGQLENLLDIFDQDEKRLKAQSEKTHAIRCGS